MNTRAEIAEWMRKLPVATRRCIANRAWLRDEWAQMAREAAARGRPAPLGFRAAPDLVPLITEPLDRIASDDPRLAAEWMAFCTGYPSLLCYCICVGLADGKGGPEEFESFRRTLVAPGALEALLSWLARLQKGDALEAFPQSWLLSLAVAPPPGEGAWVSVTQFHNALEHPAHLAQHKLTVSIGGFASEDSAARFGRVCSLFRVSGELIVTPRGLPPLRLVDDQVRVLRRREGVRCAVNQTDWTSAGIKIADYGHAGSGNAFILDVLTYDAVHRRELQRHWSMLP
jgi:hypothetical protein